MKKRVITAVFVGLTILACVLLQGWVAMAVLSACMIIAVHEVYRAIRSTGIEPVRWAGYVYCILIIASQVGAFYYSDSYRLSQTALLIAVAASMVRLVSHGKIAVESMMATFFPMLYPGVFFVAMMNLLHLKNAAIVAAALMLATFSESVSDVCALFSGMLFGKHKLSPILSPKKTIEGAVGAAICCTIFSAFIPQLLKLVFFWNEEVLSNMNSLPPLWVFAILGMIVSVVSQVGDLAASMVKRHCGVKDFGTILPGHGGIMDRMDGMLFSAAICYVYFTISQLG